MSKLNPDINVTLTPAETEAEDATLMLPSVLGKRAECDRDVAIESMAGEKTSKEHGANVELSVEQKQVYLSQSDLAAPSLLSDVALAPQGISIHSMQTGDIDMAAKLSILTTQDVSLHSSVSVPFAPAEQDVEGAGVTLESSRSVAPQEDDVTLEQMRRLLQRHKESITVDPATGGMQEQDEGVTVERRSAVKLQEDDVIIPFIPSRHGSLKSDMSIPLIPLDVADVRQSS